MNYDGHMVFVDAIHCITLCTDVAHRVQILKIAYRSSLKSREMSWMRNGEEVGLYISKSNVWVFMW